ncbi:MAG: hypothetical protein HZA49_05525 [Planctomycetes bacterium]|nr:hypothetical protein [Planctomycetota bacterium]
MKKEDIKKSIVLGVVAVALLWGVFGITHIITHGYRPVTSIDDIIRTIGYVVIIPISILVLFNIKLPLALGRPLAVLSILMALGYLAFFRSFFSEPPYPSPSLGFYTYFAGLVAWYSLCRQS